MVDELYYIWHLKLTWDIGVRALDNTIIKGSDTGKIQKRTLPKKDANVFTLFGIDNVYKVLANR